MAIRYVQQGLLYSSLDSAAFTAHVNCVEDTEALRNALPKLGLVGFVGDGAILPRSVFIMPILPDLPRSVLVLPFAHQNAKGRCAIGSLSFMGELPSLAVNVDLQQDGRFCGMGNCLGSWET